MYVKSLSESIDICGCAHHSHRILLFILALYAPAYHTSNANTYLLYCASNLILRNKFIWSMVSTVKGLAKEWSEHERKRMNE